jgi:UDP-GlcNAc:undecaprenyl-phosphate GlcNAc-1-phosphate transferase
VPPELNPIDMNVLANVLVSLVAALVMSFAATPVVKSFANRIGAIDVPKDDRRIHDHPIPRLGGLAMFLGFLLSVVLFADITKQIQGVLLGSVVVVIVGVIDDIVPLKAWIKFLAQIIAALIAVLHGVVIEVLSNPNLLSAENYVNLGFLSVPLTVIWIVAITNSVNLIDGLDGLAVGVSGIGSATMLVIALLVAEGNVAVIMAALAGACIGFMPYNMNPAKIFAGDTGALLLGYVLATMSVIGLFKVYAIISFAVPFLVLALPLFDTVFAFFRRILKGQNPMSPDRGHVHHRLIDLGLTQKQAVAILYCISTVLGLAAVVLTTSGEVKALLLILAFAAAAVIGVFLMKTANGDKENKKTEAAHEARAPAGPTAEPENCEEKPSEET